MNKNSEGLLLLELQRREDIGNEEKLELIKSLIIKRCDLVYSKFVEFTLAVLFYNEERGRHEQIGSAFFFSLDDVVYVATARHVIDINGIPRSSIKFFHKSGKLFNYHELRNGNEYFEPDIPNNLDVVIFTSCTVNKLIGELGCCGLDDLAGSEVMRAPLGVAIGYPNSKNRNILSGDKSLRKMRAFNYCGAIFSDSDTVFDGLKFPSDSHVLIEFNDKHSFDAGGDRVNSVFPRGMSGGPLVSMEDFNDGINSQMTDEPRARIIGLLIFFEKEKKVLVSVKFAEILKYLRKVKA